MSHEERNYLYQYLDVVDQHSEQLLGYLVDVSTGGLMFVSQNPIPPGQTLDLYINLDGGEGVPARIKLQASTVWNRPNLNPVLTCIGCKIDSIAPEDAQWLLKLSESLSFDHSLSIHRTADE